MVAIETSNVVAVVGSHNYPRLDVVRDVVAALDGGVLLGDRGAVALAAAAAARGRGAPVRHLSDAARKDDGTPRWHTRNRRLVLRADALIVFGDKPREALWHGVSMFGKAGTTATMYGQDGAPWNPPMGAGDPRRGGIPYYIKPNCRWCGTPLVQKDEFDGNTTDVYHDEFVCPKHPYAEYTDWPAWSRAGLRDMADEVEALADEAHATGKPIPGMVPISSLAGFRRWSKRLNKLDARARAAIATGTPAAALKAVNRLMDARPTSYEPIELFALAQERLGDAKRAAETMRIALDLYLCDSGRSAEAFQRMRGELRRLETAAAQGGARGKSH